MKNRSFVVFLFMVFLIQETVRWCWLWIENYQVHEYPYKITAAFYHFSIQISWNELVSIKNHINQAIVNSTGYPNLGIAISYGFFIAAIGIIVFITIKLLKKINISKEKFFLIYITPAGVTILYNMLQMFMNWLFMKV